MLLQSDKMPRGDVRLSSNGLRELTPTFFIQPQHQRQNDAVRTALLTSVIAAFLIHQSVLSNAQRQLPFKCPTPVAMGECAKRGLLPIALTPQQGTQ